LGGNVLQTGKELAMDLQGKSVVVIGGSSGMGLATAKLAREMGAKVTIASRSRAKLDQAVQHIGDAIAITANITNESDIKRLFAGLESVDHVFISGGILLTGRVMETDMATFRADVDQRFWGPLQVVRYAVPRMTDGSITFLSGQYGSKPRAGSVVTAAMNAATEVLAKGLALELAPIRVNAVAPGLIDTPLLGQHRDRAGKWAEEVLPVKRIGMVEEVAQAVVLLMTNGFMTGEVLHIDGGGRLV
jgi:NAD(P)-dependent dehydrogenase (short-subunit alcohol dehydrogenase family)